jgi:CHAD domain-containing protein
VLLDILTGLEANVAGTIDDTDSEFLHDLRVNVRRTRTALKLAGDGLPPGQAERFATDFAWLGALTSPVRDLDVHLLELDEVSDLDGLEPLRTHLMAQRRAQRRRLVAGLRSARFAELRTQWRHELDAAIAGPAPSTPSTGEFAARHIARADRRLVKRGAAIDDQSPAEQLHGVRKRGKELRYLLEFFASLYDQAGYKKAVGELRALQDVLGRFQDACTQREALEQFAEQLSATAPARTLLAMGELAGRLDTRASARAEFADRFARFAGTKNQRRLLELTQDRTGW